MVYEIARTVLFYLDTGVRSGGTLGQPQFTFPNNLINIKPQDGETIRLTMQEASIEYTFFQTEEFNNKLLVVETVTGPGAPPTNLRTVEIPIGNYNLTTFIIQLTQALNTGSLYKYTISYEPFINQLIYTALPLNGFAIDTIIFNFDADSSFTLNGSRLQESLNEMMGFNIDEIVSFGPNPATTALMVESTTTITMSPGVQNLYITIQNSCSNYGYANIRNTFSASNILAKIPVSNPPFSTLYFYDLNSNFSTLISNTCLDNLSLTLFNERFTKIEPRKNWSFTIKIDVLRRREANHTTDLLRELVDMTKMKIVNKEQTRKRTIKSTQKEL